MLATALLFVGLLSQDVVTPPPIVDPGLAAELSQAANSMSSQLPMTQQMPSGPITFTAMAARGNELVTMISLPLDLDHASFGAQFGQAAPTQACASPQLAALIGRGATITLLVTDSGGEKFRASVSRC